MKRLIPLSVLTVVAASGFMFGIACNAPVFDKTQSSVGIACASDTECPIYLACNAGVCTPRCAGEGSYCDTARYGYGACKSGLCLPTATNTSGSSGSSGPNGSSSCTVGGELVRSGLPAIGTSSAAALAIDATHIYVSQAGADSLGRAQSTIDAYPFAGGAATNLLTTADSYGSRIFRSGSWLYLTTTMGGMLSRIAVSAADGDAGAPEVTQVPASVVASTPTAFYVGYGGYFVRVDGETATADTYALGYGSSLALTADKAFYVAVTQPPTSEGEAGTTTPASGPTTGEIAYGPLTGGDTTYSTGLFVPDYATGFLVAGTKAFFQSPNGTLQGLDLTMATATPQTVHAPGLGQIYTDGKSLFSVASASSYGECSVFQQIDTTTGATTTLANISANYYETASIGFYGGYYYWLDGADLRRVKLPSE